MNRSICVFCSSSNDVAAHYVDAAVQLGEAIGRAGDTLVYGGGAIGLMGKLAKAVHGQGGRVVGVIPGFMRDKEIAYETADELIVTDDMRARKAVMEKRADAFVALPGGFGTLEELIEILTYRNLRLHDKPIVLLNTAGFFDPLVAVFEHFIEQKFAKERHRDSFRVICTVEDAMAYLDACLQTS